MRKHWLAVLSIFGLAGSSSPASAQVVKGTKPADTKSESTMKKSKLSQEDAASKDAGKAKWKVQSGEGGQATSDAAKVKYRKAGGDPQAQRANYLKSAKSEAELKASQGSAEYKEQKATKENTAVRVESDSKHKVQKAATENSAVGAESAYKATGKNAYGSGGGAGKVAHQDIRLKTSKSDSEIKAAQQDATMKQKKQVNQASPK